MPSMRIIFCALFTLTFFCFNSLQIRLLANNGAIHFFDGSSTVLRDLMLSNSASGLNPPKVDSASGIYEPSQNWGISLWNEAVSFQNGDLVLDNTDVIDPRILEFGANVRGNYMGNAYFSGDHVFYEGKWFFATEDVSQAVVPVNPENLLPFSQFIPYSSGDVLLGGSFTPLIARQLMKGTWNPNQSYQSGDVVQLNNSYLQLNDKHLGNWNPNLTASMGETVYYNGIFYRSSQSSAGSYLDPASDSVIWQQLGSILDSPGIMDVTNSVQVEATGFTGGMFFEVSPWKTLDQGGVSIGNPLHSGSFIDRTAMYTDLNSAMWRLSNSNSNSGDSKPMVSNISYSQRIRISPIVGELWLRPLMAINRPDIRGIMIITVPAWILRILYPPIMFLPPIIWK